jgi:hypothetical protein
VIGFIDKLASAIATAEGFFVNGSLPQRMNNPGDLRQAPWLVHPVLEHGFWEAPSLQAGIAGLMHQIALDIARGWTLRKFISTYAPPNDGNATETYIKETARRVGIPYWPLNTDGTVSTEELPLWAYLEIAEIR